jgi:ABC-2 type transport system permease protein
MNFQRIRVIIDKEWAEVFKNRLVLFTVVFLPLLFVVLPLGALYGTRAAGGSSSGPSRADLPPQFLAMCGNLPAGDCLQYFVLNEFMILFMIMPLVIPISIAAYSVVGEKTTRSLEPLLATPISTLELLIGKGLAATIPAVLATWGAFALFVVVAPLVGTTSAVIHQLLNPAWFLGVFIIGPLIAVLAVNFAVLVSSRVTDPRVAEQISAVIIVPIIGVLFGQIAGVLVLNVSFMLVAAVVLVLADIGVIYLCTGLFQREAILTKWK